MKFKITYYGITCTYSVIDQFDEDMETGDWTQPFPNEEGNSQAFGLAECMEQSVDCPPLLLGEGIQRISVKKIK